MTPEGAQLLLSRFLPQAVLLLGPGAQALGSDLGQVYGLQEAVDALDAETARRIRDEVQFIPPHPPLVYLIRLDGAGVAAQNMLLKALEEPPPWARFILTSVREPLQTIVSRCQVLRIGESGQEAAVDPRVKGQVTTAVKAARSSSQQLLTQALKGWSPEHSQVLQDWAYEAAAGRWRRFDPGFAPEVTAGEAMELLALLAKYAGSKLGPLVALAEVFSRQ